MTARRFGSCGEIEAKASDTHMFMTRQSAIALMCIVAHHREHMVRNCAAISTLFLANGIRSNFMSR